VPFTVSTVPLVPHLDLVLPGGTSVKTASPPPSRSRVVEGVRDVEVRVGHGDDVPAHPRVDVAFHDVDAGLLEVGLGGVERRARGAREVERRLGERVAVGVQVVVRGVAVLDRQQGADRDDREVRDVDAPLLVELDAFLGAHRLRPVLAGATPRRRTRQLPTPSDFASNTSRSVTISACGPQPCRGP
jgi:hypothetical protein